MSTVRTGNGDDFAVSVIDGMREYDLLRGIHYLN